MDTLKPAIQWGKRNIFWIGCFLLALTMIGSWVFSSIQLSSAQKEREREIEKQLNAIKAVSGTTAEPELDVKAHPNEATKAGMDAEINKTIDSIVRVWRKRYQEQKSIFTWPEDILGKETCNFFSRIDVPEKVSDPGQGFEKYRKQYYDNIPKFMNKICLDVGVDWQYNEELNRKKAQEREDAMKGDRDGGPGMGGMGMGGMGAGGMGAGGMGSGMGMGGGMGRDSDTSALDELNRYPVIWDKLNQALWQRKLKEFTGYDDHSGTILYPTYMQANMLQQDLWLLEAMFNNIKEINAGSASNDTSVIRTIDHVVFGREAIVQLGNLSAIDSRLGADPASLVPDPEAGMPGGMRGGPPGMQGMTMGGPPGAGGEGEALHEPIAYHERYVDPNYEAIAASQVKAVLGGELLPETNLELIVAKRVPFRLAVEMDERKINEFVAICANSEFVFEVNQIRVNRHVPGEQIEFNGGAPQNSEGAGMGGMGMGGMGMSGMGAGGMGMGMDDDGGMGMGDSDATEELESTPVESRTDFMVFVEFYGVVKIYNPVRENFLRKAAGQEVVDETADPSMVEPVVAPAANEQPAAADAPAGEQPAASDAAPAAVTPPGESAAPGAATVQPDAVPVDGGQPAGAQPAGGALPVGGAAQPGGAQPSEQPAGAAPVDGPPAGNG
ncbi:hypothetical protein [Mariniblastus fucicola]|uniref:Uncharacterized protein n=1 Tax=Mariniblastus fucicola TaxID=980251 RepID=A0A5B9P4J8_9BACT|nr:hypothetical protein [Mariniblastus fucicola]QEG21308.1 hypothetical protein MFFC18_11630 [Mariniblastus fucicola]